MKNDFLRFLGLVKRAGYLMEGYNKCEEAIKKRKVFLSIISDEASENTRNKFQRYSNGINIPCIEGYSCEELGNAIGRSEINILCVTERNMSEKLLTLHDPCQNIRR